MKMSDEEETAIEKKVSEQRQDLGTESIRQRKVQ
jgi:hypothetical protein